MDNDRDTLELDELADTEARIFDTERSGAYESEQQREYGPESSGERSEAGEPNEAAAPELQAAADSSGGRPEEWEKVAEGGTGWVLAGDKIFNERTGESYYRSDQPEAMSKHEEAVRFGQDTSNRFFHESTWREDGADGTRVSTLHLVFGTPDARGWREVTWVQIERFIPKHEDEEAGVALPEPDAGEKFHAAFETFTDAGPIAIEQEFIGLAEAEAAQSVDVREIGTIDIGSEIVVVSESVALASEVPTDHSEATEESVPADPWLVDLLRSDHLEFRAEPELPASSEAPMSEQIAESVPTETEPLASPPENASNVSEDAGERVQEETAAEPLGRVAAPVREDTQHGEMGVLLAKVDVSGKPPIETQPLPEAAMSANESVFERVREVEQTSIEESALPPRSSELPLSEAKVADKDVMNEPRLQFPETSEAATISNSELSVTAAVDARPAAEGRRGLLEVTKLDQLRSESNEGAVPKQGWRYEVLRPEHATRAPRVPSPRLVRGVEQGRKLPFASRPGPIRAVGVSRTVSGTRRRERRGIIMELAA